MSVPDNMPEYYLTTYNMISCAFPEGITEENYMPLVVILREEGNMSFRSIASFLTFVTNKDYALIYNDACFSESDRPKQSEIDHVRNMLTVCGYEEWVNTPW